MGATTAVRRLDDERARLYIDLVIVSLRATARTILEELMANGTYQYQSDFAKRYVAQGREEGKAEGREEGKAQGKALAVVTVLEARGLEVPSSVRDRILACVDIATLDTWLSRVAIAKTVAEVIAEVGDRGPSLPGLVIVSWPACPATARTT
jgi:hypothetical protein